jgi:hypothetical protein
VKDRAVFDDWRKTTHWGRLFDRYAQGPTLAPGARTQPQPRA